MELQLMSHHFTPVELMKLAREHSYTEWEKKEGRDSETEFQYFLKQGLAKRTAKVLATHISREGFRFLCMRTRIQDAVYTLNLIGPKRADEIKRVAEEHFRRNDAFFRGGKQNREYYADGSLHWP